MKNKKYELLIFKLDLLLERQLITQMEWYFALIAIRKKYNLPTI